MTVVVESPSPTPPPLSDPAALYALPISERPRRTWAQFANGVGFGFLFILGLVMTNVTQFVFVLPLQVLCLFPFGRKWYDDGIRRSKGGFGLLLGEVSRFHAHSSLGPRARFRPSSCCASWLSRVVFLGATFGR